MAFRIEKAVVRGELSNEERGVVTGRIWLAGRKDPLCLNLRGDCLRDLAGCTVRFSNPRPEIDPDLALLAPDQSGAAGELTASRKVRQPAVSERELLELLEKEQPIPCRIANCLYLEWYSEENGRVLLESADYVVAVGMPVWSMSAEEHSDQLAASQHHFHRFLQAITGDDTDTLDDEVSRAGLDEEGENDRPESEAPGPLRDDRPESGLAGDLAAGPDEDTVEAEDESPLDEFEWEQELRDADRRAEATKEALEKYHDHPEREKMIAAALGWDDEPDDDEIEAGPLRDALIEGDFEIIDGTGRAPAWNDSDAGLDEEEIEDEEEAGFHHPLSQRALDLALALQREAGERGLMGDTPESRDQSSMLSLVERIISLGAKLAGALDDWARGEELERGFIIAMLKRAQVPLNEALHVFDCLDAASLTAESRQWLRSHKRELFDLRREILDLMHQLRTS